MILITGAAGFIGTHLVIRLCELGETVIGIDNLNDYYDPQLKIDRLQALGVAYNGNSKEAMASQRFPGFTFLKLDMADATAMSQLFAKYRITKVCNLAAQAGVRYSLTNPQAYVDANITGFVNLLENCRKHDVVHLIYASSSSVYGLNKKVPFNELDRVGQPASLYAATKRSNELMAHVYSHLSGLPTTGLRFFTVYGPWGRPDMAYSIFSDAILHGRPIKVFNHGDMTRDFTYVGDIVEGVCRVLLQPRPEREGVPTVIYNIGKGGPVKLLDFIEALEAELGVEAKKEFLPMQPGDVPRTFADTRALERDYGYRADTDMKMGISQFVNWYKSYYGVPENTAL